MSDFKAEDYRLTKPGAPARDYASEHDAPTRNYANGHDEPEQQLVPDTRSTSGVVSFLSSNEKEGRWHLPRRFRALAVMGNVELDLRQAEIGYGLSVIEAVAVMGNIEITISPDIMVESDGDSLLGTFVLKYDRRANPAATNRDKVVRVIGTAYLSAVTIHVKGPDEKLLARLGRTLGFDE
ncbi:MAG TPA: LiaF domain-containing protein [Gemmatimonadaceae bacterium]|nr:LiaF domain-containing protein [Gemmatimonadaceae bacterium]